MGSVCMYYGVHLYVLWGPFVCTMGSICVQAEVNINKREMERHKN